MHAPFEHVENRALEIAQLKQQNAMLQQGLNALVEVIRDEPEAKQPMQQPGPAMAAQVVGQIIARLKRQIIAAGKPDTVPENGVKSRL